MNETVSRLPTGTAAEHSSIYQMVDGRHGRFLVNEHDIYIARSLIEYGEYSPSEWELYDKMLIGGAIVIEAGANIGAFTVPLAKKVGPQGRIYAFEPQPFIFQNMCANLALNNLTNVYAYNAGCSESEGSITIPQIQYDKDNNFGGVQLEYFKNCKEGQTVNLMVIDNIDIPRLNLLKLDVEGMELQVLKGASETIKRCQPVIYAECHPDEKAEEKLDFIHSIDYVAYIHICPLYIRNNYFSNPVNKFEKQGTMNILCFPASLNVNINLPKVTSLSDLKA